MAWNGAEIITRIRDRAELDANNTNLTDTVLLRMVNQALQQISLEADWPWLRTAANVNTVAGTPTLATPSPWLRTRLLTIADTGQPLTRVSLKQIRRYPTTITGRPHIYSIDGSVIRLSPTPDAIYTIIHDYSFDEPSLASTAGVPLIPEVYGQGVVEWAAAKALEKAQKPEKALLCKADYVSWLRRIRDNINQGREQLSVTPRPGSAF